MTPPVPGAQRQGLTRLPLCVLLPLLLVLLAPPAQLVRGQAQSQEEQNPDINSFLSPEDSEAMAVLSQWIARELLPCTFPSLFDGFYESYGAVSLGSSSYVSDPCSLSALSAWPFQCTEGNVTSIHIAPCVPSLQSSAPLGHRITLPSELSALHNLRVMQFEGTITGTLPASWSSLSALEMLVVQSLALTGTLPAEYSAITSLKSVEIQGSVSGSIPHAWSELRGLEVLVLAMDGFEGDDLLPASFSTMTNLMLLDIVVGPGSAPALQHVILPSLQYIFVYESAITGQLSAAVSELEALVWLDLRDNRISGPLPAVLPSSGILETINLHGNAMTGTIPPQWAMGEQLHRITLSGNELLGTLPAEWSQLPQALNIFLDDNRLSGTLPPSWSTLSDVLEVSLAHNNFVGSLPPDWRAMVSLQSFNASNNDLSGPLPATWSALTQLTQLDLEHNRLSGGVPLEWSRLRNLTALRLGWNQLSSNAAKALSTMHWLELLYMQSNSLSGTLPRELSALTSLRRLDIQKNTFSGPLPRQWSGLAGLLHLNLQDIPGLTGTVPASWSGMASLRSLLVPPSLCASLPQTLQAAANATGSCVAEDSMSDGGLHVAWIALSSVLGTLLVAGLVVWGKFLHHRHTCTDPLCAHRHPGFWHSLDGHMSPGARSSHCCWCLWDGQPDLAVPYSEIAPLVTGVEPFARGGFSRVYKGQWRGRTVAIKVLESHASPLDAAREAFEHEVEMSLYCNECPRMVRLFGVCQEPCTLCLINEFVAGGSLYDRIHGEGMPPLSVMETLQIAKDVAVGIDFMHPELVHRDLKPDNILLETTGRAKIIDLGLGRRNDNPLLTHIETEVSGTALYMSPEQSDGQVTTKTDIYSLGILMNECISGEVPFARFRNSLAVQMAVAVRGQRPDIPADCPAGVKGLIRRCWDQDPNRRPAIKDVIFMIDFLIEAEIASPSAHEGHGTVAKLGAPLRPESASLHLPIPEGRSHTSPPDVKS